MVIYPDTEEIPTEYKCTDCKAKMVIPQKLAVGSLLVCHACGAEFEVIKLKPFAIQQIEEEK